MDTLVQLELVKLALQYVEKQTSNMCLEAVRQNGNALNHVDKSIFSKEL